MIEHWGARMGNPDDIIRSMTTDRWNSGADYDQWMGRWSRMLAKECLKWLNIPPGLRRIDVCCGSGVVIAGMSPPRKRFKLSRHLSAGTH